MFLFSSKIFKFLLIGLFILFNFLIAKSGQAQNEVDFYLFHGQGCPYSQKLSVVLAEWQKNYPQLKVNSFEIFFNSANQKLYFVFANAYHLEVNEMPVPFVLIGEKSFIGYNEGIKNQIHQEILRCLQQHCPSPLEKLEVKKETGFLGLFSLGGWGSLLVLIGIILLVGFVFKKILLKVRTRP